MIRRSLKDLARAFGHPMPKQLEGYARYVHNLSIACIIGGTAVLYSTRYTAFTALELFLAGIMLFLAGVVLSKGT